MERYLDLKRSFLEYGDSEDAESAAQQSYMYAGFGLETDIYWDNLLESKYIVVLGEAGSGKSWEFKSQQSLLKASGKFSFFLRLENLVDGELIDAIDSADDSLYHEWLQSEDPATFFLDSVDEAKLKNHDAFAIALNRFVKNIGPNAIHQVNVVISSRISEWRSSIDKKEVCRKFGISCNDAKLVTKLKVVLLAPLNEVQLRQLAEDKHAHDIDEFIQAINHQSALEFASRPLDAELLIEYWKTNGCIGTRQELLEYSIPKKISERVDRKSLDPLTSEEARLGAEMLAAAAVLCKEFNILVPDADISSDQNALNIEVLLPNWTAHKRAALLGRPIFDGATYGRIRFHHRTTTEYLCACWLQKRMNDQLPYPDLNDILFMQVHGRLVVRPTMAAVAAWLATLGENLWNKRVRKLLLENCPETFLQFGEPRSLEKEDLKSLLSNLVSKYEGREFTRLSTENYQLSALAQPIIAEDLSAIILNKSIAEDIRIEMILAVWRGKLQPCAEALLNVVDSDDSDYIKRYAVIALKDIADNGQLIRLNTIAQKYEQLQSLLCAYLCDALYPNVIRPADLFSLIEKVSSLEDKGSMDMPYFLERLFRECDIPGNQYNDLLLGFIRLCRKPPFFEKNNKPLDVSSDFSSLGEVLMQLLINILSQNMIDKCLYPQISTALSLLENINEVSPSYRFDKDNNRLHDVLLNHPSIRRDYVWLEVARKYKDGSTFNVHAIFGHYNLFDVDPSDIEWMITDVAKSRDSFKKKQALLLAIGLSQYVVLPVNTKKRLRKILSGNRELIKILNKGMYSKYESLYFRLKYKYLSRYYWLGIKRRFKWKIKRSYNYLLDRYNLYRTISIIRAGKHFNNLNCLVQDAKERNDNTSSYTVNWRRLRKPYGNRIAKAARDGWEVFWRSYVPLINDKPYYVNIGLAGISTELNDGRLLLSSVSDEDAELMARYAINTSNDFPDWFTTLAEMSPNSVKGILNQCIDNEWSHPADDKHFYGTIAQLQYAPLIIQDLVIDQLQNNLRNSDPVNHEVLSCVLCILLSNPNSDKQVLTDISRVRLDLLSPNDLTFNDWLSILLQTSCEDGIAILEERISDDDIDGDKFMLSLASSLDPHHGTSKHIISNPSYRYAPCLRKLIPLAYRYIRGSDDIDRVGGRTSRTNSRDCAQSFRGDLLSSLANSDDVKSYRYLEELLSVPELKGKRDFILHLMDKRAIHDADLPAWLPGQVYDFEITHERLPRSNHDLFKLVSRRLNGIKDYAERDDYSPRDVFNVGTHESELRKWLAIQLRERADDKYNEVQEVEVDLEKEPDIRVLSPGIHPVSIEIKWADNWTIEELEEALTAQLVGQYLRTPDSNYGILILGYRGKKKIWRNKKDNKNVNILELTEYIQKLANDVIERNENVYGLLVLSIDFTNPAM